MPYYLHCRLNATLMARNLSPFTDTDDSDTVPLATTSSVRVHPLTDILHSRVLYSTARAWLCLTFRNKPSTALSVLLALQRRSNMRMGLTTAAVFRLLRASVYRYMRIQCCVTHCWVVCISPSLCLHGCACGGDSQPTSVGGELSGVFRVCWHCVLL